MARAHFVKKAQKARPEHGIKKGDSYYWWAFRIKPRGSRKVYSKTPPRRSQLTQSEFLGTLYDIEDDIGKLSADDGLESAVEDIVNRLNELADSQEEKKGNMPDSLQDSEIGQLLDERAEKCHGAADELDAIEFDVENRDDGQSEDDYWQAKLDEVNNVSIDAS